MKRIIVTSTPKIQSKRSKKSKKKQLSLVKPTATEVIENHIDLTLPLEKSLETITIQDDTVPEAPNVPATEVDTIVIDCDIPKALIPKVSTVSTNVDVNNDDSVIFVGEYKPKNESKSTQMTPQPPQTTCTSKSIAVNTSFENVQNTKVPVNYNFSGNNNISNFIQRILDLEAKFVQNFSVPASVKNNPQSNVYNANVKKKAGLRLIVIDGSNVAMGHSNGKYFSCRGLKICIDYFVNRGHEVKAFVPQFRRNSNQSQFPEILEDLAKQSLVVFTPSRRVQGRMIVPYDDRFIVQCAHENGGIIVSNDNYRDLLQENPTWKETIEKRLLMWTWCGDMIMFPQDPFGRGGPTLNQFLRF